MTDTQAIDATGLTKRYGEVLAVDQLSFTVAPGEIYALLGLNGAGKTTTIRMLLGMVRPTGGRVSLLGTRVRPGAHAVWSRVGYLVETPAAYPELTVTENLRVAARLRGLSGDGPVAEVIGRLDLGAYADHRARTLSLGNAQRLGLAKALIHRPALLVLDEPANGLDPAGVAEIRALLGELARDGVAVLLSSHILTEVARLATRIGVLDRGRLVWTGATADLVAQARPRLAVLVHDQAAAATALRAAGHPVSRTGNGGLELEDDLALGHPERIATVLVTAGCPPSRLAVEQDDLETCFLRLVSAS
ncbi:ABC transporter ATP-binding protein [Amycolatopsis sp. NBC_00438]|uniref:ABC transporter ATP-binding protein n=1 Tax=Amycolatopsis sp. NBC_00438 TaxID=2903558 RepID=UPI002E1F73C1